jgi:hypothetical protein
MRAHWRIVTSVRRVPRYALVSVLLSLGALPTAGTVMLACSTDDAGDPDVDPIAWVSPAPGSDVAVGEAIELSVKVNEPRAETVRFDVDGAELSR